MNLTALDFSVNNKAILKEFASLCGVQYVCTDVHKRKPCVIFSKGNYKDGFAEYICYAVDLTVDNVKLMVEYGMSR